MNNIFPVPDKTTDLHKEILSKIQVKLSRKCLDFFYFLEQLERCSENKKLDEYLIWAYYATSVVLAEKRKTDEQKAAMILDIQAGLNEFNKEEN